MTFIAKPSPTNWWLPIELSCLRRCIYIYLLYYIAFLPSLTSPFLSVDSILPHINKFFFQKPKIYQTWRRWYLKKRGEICLDFCLFTSLSLFVDSAHINGPFFRYGGDDIQVPWSSFLPCPLSGWLDLLCFCLSGLPSDGTVTAEMAMMFGESPWRAAKRWFWIRGFGEAKSSGVSIYAASPNTVFLEGRKKFVPRWHQFNWLILDCVTFFSRPQKCRDNSFIPDQEEVCALEPLESYQTMINTSGIWRCPGKCGRFWANRPNGFKAIQPFLETQQGTVSWRTLGGPVFAQLSLVWFWM